MPDHDETFVSPIDFVQRRAGLKPKDEVSSLQFLLPSLSENRLHHISEKPENSQRTQSYEPPWRRRK